MSLFANLKEAAAKTARDTAMSQIPVLIEQYGEQVDAALVSALTKLKEEHPEKARLFLDHWRPINANVEKVLGSGGRRKRTRRHKHKGRE
jgi:uncharacterized protein YmfQ (DUF2313 family)